MFRLLNSSFAFSSFFAFSFWISSVFFASSDNSSPSSIFLAFTCFSKSAIVCLIESCVSPSLNNPLVRRFFALSNWSFRSSSELGANLTSGTVVVVLPGDDVVPEDVVLPFPPLFPPLLLSSPIILAIFAI